MKIFPIITREGILVSRRRGGRMSGWGNDATVSSRKGRGEGWINRLNQRGEPQPEKGHSTRIEKI